MSRVLFAILGVFAITSVSRSQVPPRYTIDTLTETRRSCKLTALEPTGRVRAEYLDGKLDSPRLVELRQEDADLPPLLTRDFVGLTNGDRIPLDNSAPAHLGENGLTVWPSAAMPTLGGKAITLYIPYVAMIFWTVPEGIDRPEAFLAELERLPRKRDVVFLRNGDRLEGKITKLSGKDGCILRTDNRTATITWSTLAGIAWNTERSARPRARAEYYRATLECGARLNLLDVRYDAKAGKFLTKTHFDASLEIAEASLLALDVCNGPAVDLADVAPTRYEYRSFLGARWPWTKRLSTSNHPLRIAGTTFEEGVGTHAACTLEYKLDGKYSRFDSLVGIDAVSAPKGRAKVHLMLDGKRIDLNAGKEITSKTPTIALRVDVRGVRTLELHVEYGVFGDVEAHVNWAKARLLKVQ